MVKTAASHAVNIGSNPVWVTSKNYLTYKCVSDIIQWLIRSGNAFDIKDGPQPSIGVRVDCHEGPPVPIPNTEVKLMYADNTWRVTAREDR